MLVSHEKYNFVIVNLGSEDGIALGDTGVIEAQGVRVGTAKVKKLYPRMCPADVAVSSPDQKIEKNAVIKFSRLPKTAAHEHRASCGIPGRGWRGGLPRDVCFP